MHVAPGGLVLAERGNQSGDKTRRDFTPAIAAKASSYTAILRRKFLACQNGVSAYLMSLTLLAAA
jgi:hypothetical protein